MVVTDYIELFHMGTDRHNGILIALLFLVAETTINRSNKTGNLPAARFPMLWFYHQSSPVFGGQKVFQEQQLYHCKISLAYHLNGMRNI